MSNHSGSYQSNSLLHTMLSINLFDKISHKDSIILLKELGNVEDGNTGEIYEDIPEKLKYCVRCADFRDEVKYYRGRGITMCPECAKKEIDVV